MHETDAIAFMYVKFAKERSKIKWTVDINNITVINKHVLYMFKFQSWEPGSSPPDTSPVIALQ